MAASLASLFFYLFIDISSLLIISISSFSVGLPEGNGFFLSRQSLGGQASLILFLNDTSCFPPLFLFIGKKIGGGKN